MSESKSEKQLIEALEKCHSTMEKLKESESLYSTLVENSNDGIIIIQDACLAFVNEASIKYMGYSAEELLGKNILEFIVPEDRNIVFDRYNDRISGKDVPDIYEMEIIRKDGVKFPVEVSTVMITYKGYPADLVILRDITERKEDEEKLKKAYDELEIRVKERTVELVAINNKIQDEIKERKRTQKELIASYRKLKNALDSTVQAISTIGELRDPYTAGHQQRVAILANAIALEMEFKPERCEGIRIAAIVHDIGKINVPAEILSKPGQLREIEEKLIRIHCQVGYNILNEIEFPWQVADMVLQHHELFNGSGYPNGLVGEDILLEARVICVADVIEAMASHRPYRPALGIDKAMLEIKKNRGILYDPDVVDVCLKLIEEKGFKFYKVI